MHIQVCKVLLVDNMEYIVYYHTDGIIEKRVLGASALWLSIKTLEMIISEV